MSSALAAKNRYDDVGILQNVCPTASAAAALSASPFRFIFFLTGANGNTPINL